MYCKDISSFSRKMTKKEFRVNEHIVLKLEGGKTNIYVGSQYFWHCKYLLLINPHKNEKQKELNSIDEAVEVLNPDLEKKMTPEDLGITPEEEFWGHCSNLQAWAEHNYDTRLIHSNIAFSLLRELVYLKDRKAREVYKDEVILRFLNGPAKVRDYLRANNFLEIFTLEEMRSLLKEVMGEEYERILRLESIIGRELRFMSSDLGATGFYYNGNSVKKLEIMRCDIGEIPEPVGELKNLTHLSIIDCSLKNVPSWIDNLINLESLDLRSNQIKELPETIGNLQNLRKLNLSHNQFDHLPNSIKRLSSIKELNLIDNDLVYQDRKKIEELKKIFEDIDSLEIIYSTGVMITNFNKIIDIDYFNNYKN